MVICLEQGAVLHDMAQLMPLPLTVSCFSKIQIGFTFLVPAHLVVLEKEKKKQFVLHQSQKKNLRALKKHIDTCISPAWYDFLPAIIPIHYLHCVFHHLATLSYCVHVDESETGLSQSPHCEHATGC